MGAFKSFLIEAGEKKYVVIGNPGRGQSSSLWPKTDAPQLYTQAEAQKIADKCNASRSSITYGALPSQVHWHVKPIEDAHKYVLGRALTALDDLNPIK